MGTFTGAYANSIYGDGYSGYSTSYDRTSNYANRINRGTTMQMAQYNIEHGHLDEAVKMLENNNVPINSSIFNAIQQNADNSLVTGLKEGVPVFGLFANSNSDYEAAAKLTNTEVPITETLAESVGAAASGAVSGAAIGAGVGAFLVPASAGLSIPVCTGIGAAVGGGIALVRNIVGNIFS